MTNVNPNDDVLRVNQNIRKGSKKNKEKEVVAQTKQVEASSLNALSSYGKAKVSFKGHISLIEKIERISTFKERLLNEKDEQGNRVFRDSYVIDAIIDFLNVQNVLFAEKLCFAKDEQGNYLFADKSLIGEIIFAVTCANLYFDVSNDCEKNKSEHIDAEFVEKLCFGKDEQGNDLFKEKNHIDSIVSNSKRLPKEFVEKLCFGKDKEGVPFFNDKTLISSILSRANNLNLDFVKRLCFDTKENGQKVFPDEKMVNEILSWTFTYNLPVVEELCFAKDKFDKPLVEDGNVVRKILLSLKGEEECIKNTLNLIELCKNREFRVDLIPAVLEGDISVSDYSYIRELMGEKKVSSLSTEDLYLAVKNKKIYQKNNIEDLTRVEKKKILKEIVSQNSKLFKASPELKEDFPLIPSNKDEYCNLVKTLVESTTLKTEKLSKTQLSDFNVALNSLSDCVSNLSLNDVKRLVVSKDEQTYGKIRSNNKEIEKNINDILAICPNILPATNQEVKKLKQSLIMMKKIVSTPTYKNLNDSDKKILLFVSLLGNSAENLKESAFNTFYILQKFDFDKEERDKAYLLIKNQDWLKEINASNFEERKGLLKSIAFDLHYSNLFQMQKLLTRCDNSNKTNFVEMSKKIEHLISQLKLTQPLLPVTKFPSSNKIKEAITVVNDDYSTNLKGIYQDEKGMVIIKFNEVDNETWEKIGFPKGSVSKGIETIGYKKKGGETISQNCNTGNIKFFVHGFDKAEFLGNFLAFELPDSNALLSVSYAERPESKYRFFRQQGVILNTSARCVYGGGSRDAGSGGAKTIDKFKKLYAYAGSIKHQDRQFVSDLLKKELELTDDEYIKFFEQNVNKTISEIEPKEYQKKIVEAFSKINSNVRMIADRNYNEMFISNPEIMGVFTYPWEGTEVGEVKTFINNQKDFLKDYAVEHNVPFVIFGD